MRSMSYRSDWRKKSKQVYVQQVFECVYCGCPCAWHKLKSGRNVPIRVETDERTGRKSIITGSGNNMNFVPIHDCRAEAGLLLQQVERDLRDLEAGYKQCMRSIEPEIRKVFKERALEYNSQTPEMRKLMRDMLAENFRLARKTIRESTPEIRSKKALYNHLLERATSTAVY